MESSSVQTTLANHAGPKQVQQFLEQGFLRLEGVIDDAERAELRGIYDRCFAPDGEDQVTRKGLGGVDAQGRQALPQVLWPSKTFPRLLELGYFGRMRQVAQDVFGSPVQFLSEHMIQKPAGYGVATPWHQDQAYHKPGLHYRNINFWLPLDGATVASGCMHYVRGSHRGPILPHEYLNPDDPQTALVAQDQAYWSANGTAVSCPRGSATLHHSYMLHYAGPNTTDQPRRAYILVFGLEPQKLDQPWRLPWQERAK
ncbi:MAG: phytanoyl-CoA dioxygenase family protein [Phycisphaeraceae bacterium]